MGFGLKKEDLVEVSGLIDDVNAEIVDMRGELYDFNGKQKVSVCIKLVLKPEGVEETATEYYRVGDPDKFQPDEDGLGCGPAPGSNVKGYNTKSKAGKLIDAFSDLLGDKVPAKFDGFRGLVLHWSRKPFDMTGIKREVGAKDVTILLPTKVVGKVAASSGGGAKAAAAAGGGNEEAIILEALVACGGLATANAVGKQVFKTQAKNPNVKNIVKLTMDKAWLADESRPWAYDAESGNMQAIG